MFKLMVLRLLQNFHDLPIESVALTVPSVVVVMVMLAASLANDPGGSAAIVTAIITGAFGSLSILITLVCQGYVAKRQRRWDKEDRENAAKQLQETLERTAAELAAQTAEHAQLVAARLEKTEQKLDLNTALTKNASINAAEASRKTSDISASMIAAKGDIEALKELADTNKEGIADLKQRSESQSK